MGRTTIIAVMVFVSLSAGRAEPAAKHTAGAVQWKLVWSDDFSTNHIDGSKWTVATATTENFDGGINAYDSSGTYLTDGHLGFRATSHTRSSGKTYYASGQVTTKGKYSFLYGKVDVQAKLPRGAGLWPAIWMLPADRSWPPEVDIMEMIGSEPTRVFMTLHYGSSRKRQVDQSSFSGLDFSADYHVFSVEWSPGLMRWLVDGVERKRTTANVPAKAMYLRMNLSVGGDWPGMPNKGTVFPAYMLVDYVRVYQGQN